MPTNNVTCAAGNLARRVCFGLNSLVIWLSCTSVALAEDAAPAEGGKGYGVAYLIVVLLVALAMFITLRPSGRDTEIKRPGVYEDL